MAKPLYKRVMGPAYDRLPAAIRDMHDFYGRRVSEGRCQVRRGKSRLAQWLAEIFDLPKAGEDLLLRVTFDAQFGIERWTRLFGAHKMRSVQKQVFFRGTPYVLERIGPMAAVLAPTPKDGGLALETRRITLFGLPLPRFLAPQVSAREFADAGLFRFDVRVTLPIVGLLVHYRGFLIPLVKASEAAPLESGPVMLFDGVCNLCCAGVRFLIDRDRQGLIRYCALQSETGQNTARALGLPLRDFETFAVRDGEDLYIRTDGYFHLLRYLPQPWRMLSLLRTVPRPLRDWLYDRVVAIRYSLFGRRDQCMVPPPDHRERFV